MSGDNTDGTTAALDRDWGLMRPEPLDVLIVGGRATGTAVLVRLARCVPAGSVITVVDPAAVDYPAVFDDPHPLLLANTSAGINSLFPELPDDFAYFAGCASDGVVPRSVVGRYCAARSRAAAAEAVRRGVSVRRIVASCRSVAVVSGGRYLACLSNGQRVLATDVVIAVGVGPVRSPRDMRAVPPYPAARLQRLAPKQALVVGQGLSAIDAALVLCAADSHVVMTSRTGWFPAVRRRTLPYRLRTALTSEPVDLRDLVNRDCLAKGLPPLDAQFSRAVNPIERLREEIELTEDDACPWQDSIVGALDVLAAHNRQVNKDKEFVWRYLTSVILPTARRLLNHLDTGQIRVHELSSTDPTTFDLVVTATGFMPPPLHHTNHQLFFSDPPPAARPLDRLNHQFRAELTPERAPERIWAVGPASWPRAPFANFLRTATTQAQWIARQITSEHEAPVKTSVVGTGNET